MAEPRALPGLGHPLHGLEGALPLRLPFGFAPLLLGVRIARNAPGEVEKDVARAAGIVGAPARFVQRLLREPRRRLRR